MPRSHTPVRTFIFNIKYKTTYILKRKVKRVIVQLLHLNRTGNYPYISGDGFRSLAQHIYDESSDFNPAKVETGDVVFMNPDFIVAYFRDKHPHIKKKYILITQNSDLGIEEKHTKYIDEKIACWFAKNVLCGHPKIIPTPIGLTNNFLNKIGTTSDMSEMRSHDLTKKETKMSYGFSLASGTERIALKAKLDKNPLAVNVSEKTQIAYFSKMSNYSFVVSPEGNGADCHRTWEALYLRCVPIAKRNYFIEQFKEQGLPILVIDDWKEIETFTEEYLEKCYREMSHCFENDILFMEHWIARIMEEKKKIFTQSH